MYQKLQDRVSLRQGFGGCVDYISVPQSILRLAMPSFYRAAGTSKKLLTQRTQRKAAKVAKKSELPRSEFQELVLASAKRLNYDLIRLCDFFVLDDNLDRTGVGIVAGRALDRS